MKKRRHFKKPHARYDPAERYFRCVVCERDGFVRWIYAPSAIPKHLKESHGINRKDQDIMDWNEKFEEEYLKDRKEPIGVEDEAILENTTPPEAYEEERQRRLREAKARREA